MIFEREDNAERFYIDAVGPDMGAVKLGLRWAVDYANAKAHSEIGLVVASKRQIEALQAVLGDAAAKQLASTQRQVPVNGMTLRAILLSASMPLDFREGPILSVWLDDDKLEKVDDLYPPAICAISYIEGAIDGWKAAWGPTDLRTGATAEASSISNPIVEVALEELTESVNLTTGLGHPSDRTQAIQTFELLHKAGERFDPEEIRAWATSHGWQGKHAGEVAEIASKVAQGKRPRKQGMMLRENAVDRWRQKAQQNRGVGQA